MIDFHVRQVNKLNGNANYENKKLQVIESKLFVNVGSAIDDSNGREFDNAETYQPKLDEISQSEISRVST